MADKLNRYSSRITQRKSQGASQAQLYATGLVEDDMEKAQVGISSVWFEGNPCNMHLLQLSEGIKASISVQSKLWASGPSRNPFSSIGMK